MSITFPCCSGFDPESFWIDTGPPGMITKCETFVPETIKNDLKLPRPGQAFRKTQPVLGTVSTSIDSHICYPIFTSSPSCYLSSWGK